MPRRFVREVNLNENAPNDFEICCCCCCHLWMYFCCCKKMKNTLRVKMLWIYAMIAGLTMGIITGVVLFGAVETEFTPTDTRIVTHRLSSIFCDSVDIDAQSSDVGESPRFSAFLMNHEPNIDTDRLERFNTTAVNYVERGDYNYQVFYLLKGSKVKSRSTVDSYFDHMIIKGKTNFQKFVSNNFICDTLDTMGCVYSDVEILPHSKNVFSWDIGDTEDYYFVFISRIKGSWIDTTYQLIRTVYDTSDSVSLALCSKTMTCVYDFNFNAPVYVIIHMDKPDRDNVYPDSRDIIETSCIARSWLYVVIFFCCPGLICFLVSVCIFKWCTDPPSGNAQRNEERPTERTPLLWNWDTNVPTVMVQPPKYEDIVQSAGNDLPSYEEATCSNSINK